jgi:D-3-phosphoglycerate dehydrogenase
MSVLNVFIADDFDAGVLNGLQAAGIHYSYKPNADRTEIISACKSYQVLVLRSKLILNEQTLKECTALKYIFRGGAGMDNIDTVAAENFGIQCYNAGEANSVAVAEHCLGVLLGLLRNIVKADKEVRKRVWLREENRGTELRSHKIGIIGFGNTGSAFGNMMAALGCKVYAYDKYKTGFGTNKIQECSLEVLKLEADVVSMHVPLTNETEKYIDSEFIQAMKNPFYLMNMSRGPVVCLNSVMDALDKCKIIGFGADVLENENLQTLSEKEEATFERAINQNKVIFTPHIAGWTDESYWKIGQILLEKINNLV